MTDTTRCGFFRCTAAAVVQTWQTGTSYGDLTVVEGDPVVVTHVDGRRWAVELEKKEVTGVISSCGDAPKTSALWVASAIEAMPPLPIQ